MIKTVVLTGLLLLFQFGSGICYDLKTGEALFNDPSLGTNGKSCATCHPNGKGLEEAGEYNVEMLTEFMNFCIRDALKGQLLPHDDPRLAAMEKYVRTFYKPKK
ncbi:MAG: cytochrome C [Desulfuromonas sp.]|nr:MAG: cytochrome C [Desulfuromonas sp.]